MTEATVGATPEAPLDRVHGVRDALGVPWRRWAAWLAVPMALMGTVLYAAVPLAYMSLPIAVLVILAAAAVLAVSGQRRLVLLPVVAAFLPSLQAGFAAELLTLAYFTALYGGQRLRRPLDAVDWLLLAVVGWAVGSWVMNLGIQTDLWSLPVFGLTFLSPWLLVFVARAVAWTRDDLRLVLGLWVALAASQIAPALLKPLVIGARSAYAVPLDLLQVLQVPLISTLVGDVSADLTTGTTQSAHHLGIVLLLLLVLLASLAIASRRRILTPFVAIVAYVFLMTDSKHVLLAAALPAIGYAAVVIWPVLSLAQRRASRVAITALVLVVAPVVAGAVARIVVNGIWKPYVALATINPKVQLVLRTSRLLGRNDLNTWIGFGPGSYATRAATIRATDVLFKEGNQLPSFIPPHTGQAYRSVAYDLYTSAIADQAKFRSGVLTNPFSSLVGIVAEFGVLGAIVVLAFVGALTRAGYRLWRRVDAAPGLRAAGATLGFAMPLMVFLGVFDSYFEQPDLTGALAVLAIVVLAGLDQPRGGTLGA